MKDTTSLGEVQNVLPFVVMATSGYSNNVMTATLTLMTAVQALVRSSMILCVRISQAIVAILAT